MHWLNVYLARATIDARLASAHELRQGRRIDVERRAQRRRERRLAIVRWWQHRAWHGPDAGARTLVPAAPVRSTSDRLAHVLEEAAHRVAEQGTSTERRLLEAMSEVAAQSAPGAAAALVDPDGTETSRLRAFGLVHSHLLNVLGTREHAWLLDLLADRRTAHDTGRPPRPSPSYRWASRVTQHQNRFITVSVSCTAVGS